MRCHRDSRTRKVHIGLTFLQLFFVFISFAIFCSVTAVGGHNQLRPISNRKGQSGQKVPAKSTVRKRKNEVQKGGR